MTKKIQQMLALNEKDLRSLRDLAEQGKMVPFVGAGMSCSVGLPSWREFLRNSAAPLGLKDEVEAAMGTGDFPGAASLVASKIDLQQAIESTFGDVVINGRKASEPIALVPHLCNGLVATTNFDNVLECVFHESGRPFSARHIGAAMQMATVALIYDQHHLLKLHGSCESAQDRVLTPQEYLGAYGGLTVEDLNIANRLPFLMVQLFSSRHMLFIGCSLSNDLTVELLRSIYEKTRTSKHFALMPDNLSKLDFERLRDCGIKTILYPANERDAAITSLLRAILPNRSPSLGMSIVFNALGLFSLVIALSSFIGFRQYIAHDPGPTILSLGLIGTSIFQIPMLFVAVVFAKRTPSQSSTERLMPGFGARMRRRLKKLRWLVWVAYVFVPLYICGSFLESQKHLKIVRLRTPEYGYHSLETIAYPEFFRLSSVDMRMILDGSPHYRWDVEDGDMAYPFLQPWLQTLLGAAAILLGAYYTLICFTGWRCNKLRTCIRLTPKAVVHKRVDLPSQ